MWCAHKHTCICTCHIFHLVRFPKKNRLSLFIVGFPINIWWVLNTYNWGSPFEQLSRVPGINAPIAHAVLFGGIGVPQDHPTEPVQPTELGQNLWKIRNMWQIYTNTQIYTNISPKFPNSPKKSASLHPLHHAPPQRNQETQSSPKLQGQ